MGFVEEGVKKLFERGLEVPGELYDALKDVYRGNRARQLRYKLDYEEKYREIGNKFREGVMKILSEYVGKGISDHNLSEYMKYEVAPDVTAIIPGRYHIRIESLKDRLHGEEIPLGYVTHTIIDRAAANDKDKELCERLKGPEEAEDIIRDMHLFPVDFIENRMNDLENRVREWKGKEKEKEKVEKGPLKFSIAAVLAVISLLGVFIINSYMASSSSGSVTGMVVSMPAILNWLLIASVILSSYLVLKYKKI
jgi:hypothetical protein